MYIYIYISDIVSVTNRVQNRAHAKNQPRFYVESRHDSFRPYHKSMKSVKNKKTDKTYLNSDACRIFEQMFRYLLLDLDTI